MQYNQIIKTYFNDIMIRYGLKFHELSDECAILYGKSYALQIVIRHGEVYLDFITKLNGKYVCIDIWNYCVGQFTADDRAVIKSASSDDVVINSLIVLSFGMENHFSDMLRGSMEWLHDYTNSKMALPVRSADAAVVELLTNNMK